MKFKKDYGVGEEIFLKIQGIEDEVPFTVVDIRTKVGSKRRIYTLGCNYALALIWWNEIDEDGKVTVDDWQNSYLRKWLHNDFYLRLPQEVRFILSKRNSKCYTYDGRLSIVEDQIWVPSLSELGFINVRTLDNGYDEGNSMRLFGGVSVVQEFNPWFKKELIGSGIECSMWTRSQNRQGDGMIILGRGDDIERPQGVVPFFDIAP